VRPFGDAFARQVDLPDDLLDSEAHYVIVDEGPGLSGSSFGAIGDWLEERGVPLERIAFIPSHTDDPGPQASKTHLHRWQRAQRVPADFGGRLPKLARTWAAGFLEPHDQLKFAGLGATGERKLELARTLHGAGLTPQPVGLVHGFLIERPPEKAGPLEPDEKPVPEIARYIVERANLFPTGEHGGASIAQLLVMCRRNISLALGGAALSAIGCLDADRLSSGVVRVRTDNRMDRTNWLRTPDGRLIKADALDHHQGHDLIGCQDPAWDVAGAIAEFELSDRESEALIQLIEQNGRRVDPELLAFYRIAYAAFRLGQATLAKDLHAERYVSVLHDLLHQHVCGATPQESSVG
jgi:hypothetical protein